MKMFCSALKNRLNILTSQPLNLMVAFGFNEEESPKAKAEGASYSPYGYTKEILCCKPPKNDRSDSRLEDLHIVMAILVASKVSK